MANLPKIELHAHLNGCIRESTLLDLADERHVTVPPNLLLHNHHHPNHYRRRSLTECFAIFAHLKRIITDLPALERITREALEDFALQSVVYLELRTTPKRLLRRRQHHENNNDGNFFWASKKEYLDTVLRVMHDFQRQEHERYQAELAGVAQQQQPNETTLSPLSGSSSIRLPLTCRLIVAVDRGQSLEEAQDTWRVVQELWQLQQKINTDGRYGLIVGVDLGGNPTLQDFDLFRPLFQQARDAGLKVTLHCAEIPGAEPQEETDAEDASTTGARNRARKEAIAMLDFQPDRLGHALLLPSDLRRRLAQLRIPVETCPTSNILTLELTNTISFEQSQSDESIETQKGGNSQTTKDNNDGILLKALRQHPALGEWLGQDHPLAVSTDDPGIFDTDLTKEFLLVQEAFGLSNERLIQLLRQPLEYAFCEEPVKQQIRTQMDGVLQQLQHEPAAK